MAVSVSDRQRAVKKILGAARRPWNVPSWLEQVEQKRTGVSQIEIVDKGEPKTEALDPLVIENARPYELAQQRADRLERAQREIKVLRGIIPICFRCKKMRNDEGFWQQVESSIGEHTEAEFTHGLCPGCARKLYPEQFVAENSLHT